MNQIAAALPQNSLYPLSLMTSDAAPVDKTSSFSFNPSAIFSLFTGNIAAMGSSSAARGIANFIEYFVGGTWATLAFSSAISFCYDIGSLLKIGPIVKKESNSDFKVFRLFAKCISSLISTFGMASYLADWANKVQWINLGSLSVLLKPIGYGASLVVSFIDLPFKWLDLMNVKEKIYQLEDGVKKNYQIEHQRFLVIEIVVLISTIVWAILGIATLWIASPVLSALSLIALSISLVAATLSFGYKCYIDKAHQHSSNKELPALCT